METIEDDVEALPLANGTVDAAVCVAAIAHLQSPQQALCEWHRVLRRGGQLGFQVFAAGTMIAPLVLRETAAAHGVVLTDPNQAMGSLKVIDHSLADAGFALEEISISAWSAPIPRAEALWNVMSAGVLATPLGKLDADFRVELRHEFALKLAEATKARHGKEDHVCYFVRALST